MCVVCACIDSDLRCCCCFAQVEIFQFKRFYEDIREKISASMASSSTENARPSTSRSSRKRNKSISTTSSSAYY